MYIKVRSVGGNFLDLITNNTFLFKTHTDYHDNYHMIFELADGGTLREHLEKRFEDLTWKDKYKLGLDITNGLKHLHELDIIHKDLVIIAHVDCID